MFRMGRGHFWWRIPHYPPVEDHGKHSNMICLQFLKDYKYDPCSNAPLTGARLAVDSPTNPHLIPT